MTIIERSIHSKWLSNTYLIADKAGGHGVLIDTGGPFEPIARVIEEQKITITHILNTHHHIDHIYENQRYVDLSGAPICAHSTEQHMIQGCTECLEDEAEIKSGDLRIKALHVPGHTCGQLAFLIDDVGVFTGDTLFAGSIGGTRGPGHTTFEDIRESLMNRLMTLPKTMKVFPGHTEATSIGEEWEKNPFIRAFRGAESPGQGDCLAFGEPAILKVLAADYDGGTKAWVKFKDSGEESIVPGSRVEQI
jgi:hydroxyacylglutathione hydrolase